MIRVLKPLANGCGASSRYHRPFGSNTTTVTTTHPARHCRHSLSRSTMAITTIFLVLPWPACTFSLIRGGGIHPGFVRVHARTSVSTCYRWSTVKRVQISTSSPLLLRSLEVPCYLINSVLLNDNLCNYTAGEHVYLKVSSHGVDEWFGCIDNSFCLWCAHVPCFWLRG
ncbi:hypothetical protein BDQ17DRAFT_726787 [Cyathus striatus]|nr:hypothetical protein BDQ17DRAFT_726787 [Cyathus striatus]